MDYIAAEYKGVWQRKWQRGSDRLKGYSIGANSLLGMKKGIAARTKKLDIGEEKKVCSCAGFPIAFSRRFSGRK